MVKASNIKSKLKSRSKTQRTLSLLLSGKGTKAKKYAGKHVLVVGNKVVLLKEKREDIWKDIKKLEKEYGETPIITFVPRQDISYILLMICE